MDSNVNSLLPSSPYCRSLFLGSFKPNLQISQSSMNRTFSGDLSSIPSLKFKPNRRLPAVNSMSKAELYNSSSGVELKATEEVKEIVNPVYAPTPSNRPLRTPHSGYHFDGTRRKFFEGWYFKVSIAEERQSFCFMYSVENPAFNKKLNSFEQIQYGPRSTGVGAQILGADDKYICQYTEESHNFWGSRHELMLGNSFSVEKGKRPPNGEVSPQVFNQTVGEGFQVTPIWHQGFIRDDGRTNYAETVRPVPKKMVEIMIFLYGRVQCNVFKGASGEVGLTCGGGLRQLPGLNGTFENAALIGVHFGGVFYEFVPWNGVVEWEVAQWGSWHITADNGTHKVEVEASTKDPGTTLRAPTTEAGLVPACKDTCFAHLTLKLWEKGPNGTKGKLILEARSDMAAVEVGGGPWFNTWTYTPEILNRALNLPFDFEGILDSFPLLKPPGL